MLDSFSSASVHCLTRMVSHRFLLSVLQWQAPACSLCVWFRPIWHCRTSSLLTCTWSRRPASKPVRQDSGALYFTNFIETEDFPTSVESTLATSSIEVYGHNGTLVIKSQGTPASYAIYSISGKLINYGTTEHGQSQMSLPHGINIVKAGCKKYKIIL